MKKVILVSVILGGMVYFLAGCTTASQDRLKSAASTAREVICDPAIDAMIANVTEPLEGAE